MGIKFLIPPQNFNLSEELNGKPDGEYVLNSTKFQFDEFSKEKELVDFLIMNIDKFCTKYLNDELVSFEVDKPIKKQVYMSPRGRRVDIFVKGKNGIYIIEVKKPKSGTEMRGAIGQLLDYGREYLDSKKELILISDYYDIHTAKTIKFYNLPIRYIIFSKNKTLEFNETIE